MGDNFSEFLRIAKQLNEKGIIPLLMGSVGLEYLTHVDWNSEDIDIHVKGNPLGWEAPDETRIDDWPTICTIMNQLNYELIDVHEHEFSDHIHSVEFAAIDTLPSFAGINLDELNLVRLAGVKFYLPNAEQYLKIYQSSYKDSYRADHNNHKDLDKINYLHQLTA